MQSDRLTRQAERAAKARQRELQRMQKELAKLNALEQARLEVAEFENQIDLLTSLHKEASADINWEPFGSLIPPCPPVRLPRRELARLFDHARSWSTERNADGAAAASAGQAEDDQTYRSAVDKYELELGNWKRVRALSQRVLAGLPAAYMEALTEFSNLSEISSLGSAIDITVHSPRLMECRLEVNGRDTIPKEAKSLTAAGNLAVKAMPKGRFHEIYQDYVCSAVLRLARVVTSILPVQTVLITASVDNVDPQTGRLIELPVLSASISRSQLEQLDFETLDPSDTLESFPHRGDVLASRKTGTFTSITPLTPADLTAANSEENTLTTLIDRARELRMHIARERKRSTPAQPETPAEDPLEA